MIKNTYAYFNILNMFNVGGMLLSSFKIVIDVMIRPAEPPSLDLDPLDAFVPAHRHGYRCSMRNVIYMLSVY